MVREILPTTRLGTKDFLNERGRIRFTQFVIIHVSKVDYSKKSDRNVLIHKLVVCYTPFEENTNEH